MPDDRATVNPRHDPKPVGAPPSGGPPPPLGPHDTAQPDSTRARARLVAVVGSAVIILVLVLALRSSDGSRAAISAVSSTAPPTSALERSGGSTTTSIKPTMTTASAAAGAPTSTPSAEGLSVLPARTTEVATATAELESIVVYAGSTGDQRQQVMSAAGDYGQRQVFVVEARQDDRLYVSLPVRPNGTKGWVDADDVVVHSHDYQIQVSISEYRLLLQRGSDVLIDTAVSVGTSDTPTVGGDFYTWVLIDPTNSGYGAYAYGLSGFSTLERFGGGDGRMGIHGTSDTASIGRSVSHGCVRVPDDVVIRMVEEIGLPLGVPVDILA